MSGENSGMAGGFPGDYAPAAGRLSEAGPLRRHRDGRLLLSCPATEEHVIATFHAFTLDSDRRRLLRHGAEVHLTPKAFDLLTLLLEEAPRVVLKAELHARLWPDTIVSDTTLVGLVKEVRRGLDAHEADAALVRTVPRVGYAFDGPIERIESMARTPGVSRWVVVGRRNYGLMTGENLIGRHPASHVTVDAAGVSRRHARIVVDAREALLEDLGSKNGTIVHDTRLTGPVVLRNGDRIQIGPIAMIYRESYEGPSTETVTREP
jgi:DNA-binding winged helix-turn-helix (wHTH) protein